MRMTALLICVPALCGGAAPKTVTVSVRASSEETGYEAYRVLDGDPRTMWHTQWQGAVPRHPHEIVIDLGARYPISGLVHIPRGDGTPNGRIAGYEIRVSAEAKAADPHVHTGAFDRSAPEDRVIFPAAVEGRFITLRALGEVNGGPWASIAELRILVDGVRFIAAPASSLAQRFPELDGKPPTEIQAQYTGLWRDIDRRAHIQRHAPQTFHREALILPSDRDPADIVYRRTAALLEDIRCMAGAGAMDALAAELARLGAQVDAIAPSEAAARFALFEALCALRRRIAFANPLLDFDEILFITRHRSTYSHMCDQYYGAYTPAGGGITILSDPFGPAPRVRNVLESRTVQRGRLKGTVLEGGSFLSPSLSFDGKTLLFAYVECTGDTAHRHHTDPSRGHWHEGRCYHIFTVNVDGSGLEQLTDGTWNDFDPCWLPNGRIAFISERRGGYLRCGRACPTYTLHDMAADGSDIRCLSPHETNEWHPSVTHDGMIIYTRWDYVDRHGCVAHLPWITTPDGRDARALHGNFAPRELRPDMELSARAIPGSHRYVATAAPHHGQAFGALVIIDPRVEDDDAMAPVARFTPEVDFPETQGGAQVYGTPWPLSEKYHLCVYDASMRPGTGTEGGKYLRGDYGIYLVDAFGNRELLWRDPSIACLSPMPLAPRAAPPIVPDAPRHIIAGREHEGVLGVFDVYQGLKPWPDGTRITALRVYQIIPMSVPSGNPPHEIGLRLPTGLDSVILARYVVGTVPVEADGSAYFTAPADRGLFFQALDERGLAVQSMRSSTYVKPGERLLCHGCHEPRGRAPRAPASLPLAFRRPPSAPAPDVDGTHPFSYPRLVQPVLDRHCLSCHNENPDKAPRLDATLVAEGRNRWYASYHSLAPEYGFWQYGDRHRTTPGRFGARASKLLEILENGHHDVQLPPEDLHRLTVWLDSCSVFYGVYEKEGGEAQLRGEVVHPTLE